MLGYLVGPNVITKVLKRQKKLNYKKEEAWTWY